MIHSVDPRQNRLFDPFDGVIPPVGRRIIADGWQGVFRHVLLEVMPVAELGSHFSDSMGAPTKELYSMAGLVFLAGWPRHRTRCLGAGGTRGFGRDSAGGRAAAHEAPLAAAPPGRA